MGTKLQISDDLSLPRDAQTETFVVYGGKGTGKTSFGSVLSEELYAARLKFSAIDPMGVMYGLKFKPDGSPGLDVLLLGGRHGDIPIEPTAGAVVADLVVDESVSTIIDISGWPTGKMWSRAERIRFVADYTTRLYERQGEKRRPLMQIVDEAGRYCPQTIPHGAVDLARCVGAVEQLVEEGRNVGVGVCLITQRSARMNKSVSELAECMIAFRTVGPRSMAAILDWFGDNVPKERWKELSDGLRKLPRGTALVVSPGWLEFEGVVAMRRRDTLDTSGTPTAKRRRMHTARPIRDLDKYKTRMAETIAKAAADDPRALRIRIAELEKQLKLSSTSPKSSPSRLATTPERKAVRVEVKRVEVPVFDKEVRREIVGAVQRFEKLVAAAGQTADGMVQQMLGLHQALRSMSEQTSKADAIVAVARRITDQPAAVERGTASPAANGKPLRDQAKPAKIDMGGYYPRGRVAGAGDTEKKTVVGYEQALLDAIRRFESLGIEAPDRGHVAAIAGKSPRSSACLTAFARLRKNEMIDYPSASTASLTAAGRALTSDLQAPASFDDLVDAYKQHVLSGYEGKLLDALVWARGQTLSREQLAERSGTSTKSSMFLTGLASMRKIGLVEYDDGGVRLGIDQSKTFS